jgi:hypothetical protein
MSLSFLVISTLRQQIYFYFNRKVFKKDMILGFGLTILTELAFRATILSFFSYL